jgi:hypothetical protein
MGRIQAHQPQACPAVVRVTTTPHPIFRTTRFPESVQVLSRALHEPARAAQLEAQVPGVDTWSSGSIGRCTLDAPYATYTLMKGGMVCARILQGIRALVRSLFQVGARPLTRYGLLLLPNTFSVLVKLVRINSPITHARSNLGPADVSTIFHDKGRYTLYHTTWLTLFGMSNCRLQFTVYGVYGKCEFDRCVVMLGCADNGQRPACVSSFWVSLNDLEH